MLLFHKGCCNFPRIMRGTDDKSSGMFASRYWVSHMLFVHHRCLIPWPWQKWTEKLRCLLRPRFLNGSLAQKHLQTNSGIFLHLLFIQDPAYPPECLGLVLWVINCCPRAPYARTQLLFPRSLLIPLMDVSLAVAEVASLLWTESGLL